MFRNFIFQKLNSELNADDFLSKPETYTWICKESSFVNKDYKHTTGDFRLIKDNKLWKKFRANDFFFFDKFLFLFLSNLQTQLLSSKKNIEIFYKKQTKKKLVQR